MEKAADGESVEYSSKEELKWRLKLIDVLQNTYEKSNDISDGIRLLNAMWAVRQNINYPDDDKVKVCERALEIAKQLWNTFNTPQVERFIGISYDNLAETLAYVGRLDEAEVRFREELDFDKQLVDKYGTHLYFLYMEPHLEKKSKRNVLTSGAASTYIFPVVVKASKSEQEMITTDRAELQKILAERRKKNNE